MPVLIGMAPARISSPEPILAPRRATSRRRPWVRALLVIGSAALLFAALVGVGWWAGQRSGSAATPIVVSDEQNTIDVLARFAPSTASLQVIVNGEMTGGGGATSEQPQQSSGSGFVVDLHGRKYLVSNFHVVEAALEEGEATMLEDSQILAAFPEHRSVPVHVVGVNPSFDLALLEAAEVSTPLPDVEPIPIADSDEVRTGQKAIAIGNPFGFDSTATVGVVSATGRFLESVGEVAIPMIQTDAAVNPGNSGGALLNSSGELIGVNTALFNPNAGSFAGLGFAVPSNLLSEALANLELGGVSDITDTRASLGVGLVSLAFYPPDVREAAGLPGRGAMIISVVDGGAADRAGLQAAESTVSFGRFELPTDGDILLEVAGVVVPNADALNRAVTYGLDEGDTVELLVLRDGVEQIIEVVVD